MTRVLVTGATGTLGREAVKRLLQEGCAVRAMSRKPRSHSDGDRAEWVVGDLTTTEGLDDAVKDVDVVLHAATSPVRRTRRVDVDGTRTLISAARTAGIEHIVYPSIIGVDQVPYPYYRSKVAAERAITESGLPYTVLRAAKFHAFVDTLLGMAARPPVMLLPADFVDQPVDAPAVAHRLVDVISRGPVGYTQEVAGPEILTYRELAESWMKARDLRKRIVHVPVPGRLATQFRQGATTNPGADLRGITWSEWLRRTYTEEARGEREVIC